MKKQIDSINENLAKSYDAEFDLIYLFKFLVRNKILISAITIFFSFGAFLFSFSLKKVWQGQFQIVVSEKQSEKSKAKKLSNK